MRERLLGAFVLLTLLTVTIYGVPRALIRAGVVTEQAQEEVAHNARVAAAVLGSRLEAGLPVDGAQLDFLGDEGTQVLYLVEGRDPIVLAGGGVGGPAEEAVTARIPLADGAVVEARRPRAALRRDVVEELRPIVLTGLVSLSVALAVGLFASWRLARPFQDLAERAALMGESGSATVDLPRQPVREAEAIASALRTSSARLDLLLRREREFARNAQHQLRTPLTGIRLRVEDLSTWPEVVPPVRRELASVLAEVDRLSSTVTDLLALAREELLRPVEETPLSDVVDSVAQRWAPLAVASARELRVAAPRVLVRIATGPVDQILDVLVDNALRHGSGRVTLTGAVEKGWVVMTVQDDGDLDVEESFMFARGRSSHRSGGHGIGLALSAELAEAMGGRLRVARRQPTVMALELPPAPPSP